MDCRQNEIVSSLMASYCEVGGINHVDCGNLPSKRAIATLCEDLLHLLFPGFFSEEAVSSQELELMTNELVASMRERLNTEVRRSLRLNGATENRDAEVSGLVCRFLMGLAEVRALLQTDVEAAYEGDPAARCFEEIILAYPGLEAIAIQRTAHVLYKENVPVIPRMMTEWAHSRTGIDMHPGAEIGTHFFIDHGTGVVIGETATIGDNVSILQNVTLGGNGKETGDRHPKIGDNVLLAAREKVLGNIRVGNCSRIAAGSVVLKDVPPCKTVAGIPARIVGEAGSISANDAPESSSAANRKVGGAGRSG